MKSTGTAYLVWCGCFLGVFGLHRLYTGNIVTAIIWFLTFGIFGIGQLVDLVLVPRLVRTANLGFEAAVRRVERNPPDRR